DGVRPAGLGEDSRAALADGLDLINLQRARSAQRVSAAGAGSRAEDQVPARAGRITRQGDLMDAGGLVERAGAFVSDVLVTVEKKESRPVERIGGGGTDAVGDG